MGIWSREVVPRIVDLALRGDDVSKLRRRCMEGLSGVVVEPGFGTGLNVPHYPHAVQKVWAIDPSERSKVMAADRISASPIDIELIGLTGEQIPLDDDSCDAALVTFTLCTIPDHFAALAELRRVLRQGGTLHFLEHGLATDDRVQRWQHRLTPVQRKLADGCHLNRPVLADLASAGFDVLWSDARFVGRPKSAAWFTLGVARNP